MRHLGEFDSAFWRVLAMRLVQYPMAGPQRLAAGRWLGALAASPEREAARREIVRAIEDTALDMLALAEAGGSTESEQRWMLIGILIPLLEPPLTQWVDPSLARLLPYVLSLRHVRGTIATVHEEGTSGAEDVILAITDSREEEIAIDAIREALASGGGDDLAFSLDVARFNLLAPAPPDGDPVPVPIEVPLVRLLIHDDRYVQGYLVRRLRAVFEYIDPPLAAAIRPLEVPRLETNSLSRRRAILNFCRDYLSSTYFDLRRDLIHGLGRLRSKSLVELDALCGGQLDDIADASAFYTAAVTDAAVRLPAPTVLTLNLFLIASEEGARHQVEFIRGVDRELREHHRGKGFDLTAAAECVLEASNTFHGLHSLLVLLSLCSQPQGADGLVEVGTQPLPAQEWVRQCVQFLLTAADGPHREPSAARPSEPQKERRRRNVHALSMRIATWISASPLHIRELAERSEPGERVVYGWLLRAFILTDRLLPVLGGAGEWDPEEVEPNLQAVAESLGVEACANEYPDVVDPFLYGVGRYDHTVVMLLGLLRWSWAPLAESNNGSGRPFWWTAELKQVLEAIASRPETEAEAVMRKRREQPNSNRLEVTLTRTPPELARQILELAECGCGPIDAPAKP